MFNKIKNFIGYFKLKIHMTQTWTCLKNQKFEYQSYSIIPIQKEHIESIRCWRNNQIEILRQDSPITKKQQESYFNKKIWPSMLEKKPSNILMSFLHKDKLIGYGGLVHISWINFRAELSFLLDNNRCNDNLVYYKDFLTFLVLIKKMAFSDLGLHRLFTETFDRRNYHIMILEEFGFKKEGIMKDHIKEKNNYFNSVIHGMIGD